MPSETKITRLLSELTKLTSRGQVEWRMVDAPEALSRGTSDIYPVYLETEYKSQKIGLAQRRYQAFDGENDRFYWTEEISLLFFDTFDRVTWQSSNPRAAIYTLFDTAREQVADIDGILKNLLGTEDDDEL